MRILDLGYSPCPNDTFIMAALAQERVVSSLGLRHVLADVETLNQWALAGRLDVTKLSFMALGKVRSTYGLLYSGTAMGFGCGPLVVARSVDDAIRRSLEQADMASADTMTYVHMHAQEMDPDVVAQHIALYVNAFSHALPDEGRAAVAALFARAEAAELIPKADVPLMAYEL